MKNLQKGLEKLFWAKDAHDIQNSLGFFRKFFEDLGVPSYRLREPCISTQWGNIWLSGNGRTDVVFDLPTAEYIEKHWLKNSNLELVLSRVFATLNSIIDHAEELQKMIVRVPKIELSARVNVSKFKTTQINLENLKSYQNFSKFILSLEKSEVSNLFFTSAYRGHSDLIRINEVYVKNETTVREVSFFDLPHVIYMPGKSQIDIRFCEDEKDFYLEESSYF